jgi:hypothetical protein
MPDKIYDNYGYVYCLYNKYMPNICKIGYVNKPDKTSHDRAKELSRHTNCPVPFEVVFDIKVRNPQKYEKIIHKKLKKFRINIKREFFECNPEDIITYFEKNNLIKNFDEIDEIDDFADNYLTIYKKDIIIKNKDIEKDNNIKYIRIYKLSDIFYLFVILFNIILTICYYAYIFIKYIIKII